jgi:hypothetical protein
LLTHGLIRIVLIGSSNKSGEFSLFLFFSSFSSLGVSIFGIFMVTFSTFSGFGSFGGFGVTTGFVTGLGIEMGGIGFGGATFGTGIGAGFGVNVDFVGGGFTGVSMSLSLESLLDSDMTIPKSRLTIFDDYFLSTIQNAGYVRSGNPTNYSKTLLVLRK